jgi:signal transduction histidine kinase
MGAPLRGRLLLAERYADFGLHEAARATLERARSQAPESVEVLEAQCRLALAAGDGKEARRFAQSLAAIEPGPGSRLILGEAQLAAGERDAARFSFATVLEARDAAPIDRARALLGRARVALAEEDDGGAGAAAMTALDELWRAGDVAAASLALVERAMTTAARAGRADDVAVAVDELAAIDRPPVPPPFCRALLCAARRAAGDAGVSDAEVEEALAACGDFLPARLRLVELRLRRRHRDAAARAQAIADLERLAAELEAGELTGAEPSRSLSASVQLLLAAAYDDEPSELGRAEAAYRRGLELRPGQLSAATRLASLASARGDRRAALEAAAVALTIDSASHLGWLAAARLCGVPGPADTAAVAHLLEAAEPGGGSVAGAACRLLGAAAEVARAELLAGMYARGHRVKNLLGIAGSRARKARKLAGHDNDNPDELAARLADLESELTALYEEWAQYLRSMHEEGSATEVVAVGPLLEEVVAAARAAGTTPVDLEAGDPLPELRGDRMLLREALLNLVANAVEACAGGGRVTVSAVVRPVGSAPVLEIAVRDTGPGISERELARVTAPGYTTKESGSGLGLAVAERVVAAHRGRLLIDSEVGRGTAVTALLPFDLPGVGYPE